MWGKSFISKTLDLQLIKHWSKSCWSWLNDPRHWLRSSLDLELTVSCKGQRPPPAGESRSWRKLNGCVLCTGTVQTAVPKAGRKAEDSFGLLATLVWTHCPKGAEIRKSPEISEKRVHLCAVPWKKEFVGYSSNPRSPCYPGRRLTRVPTGVYAVDLLAVLHSHLENTSHTCWVSLSDFVSGLN